MRHLIGIFLFLIIFSCENNTGKSTNESDTTHHTIDFGAFRMKTPNNWRKIELKGIDSYVGGLTNGIDSLIFDYGQYSNDLQDDSEMQLYADDTINGKLGLITKPKIKGQGLLGIYFDNVDGEKFNLSANNNSKNEDTIISIFQSIKFKTSDTTLNSKALKFATREF